MAKNSLLIITKSYPYTPQNYKVDLEKECKKLELKYLYFDTSYDDHKVHEDNRKIQLGALFT